MSSVDTDDESSSLLVNSPVERKMLYCNEYLENILFNTLQV
jgi:hypothetical protein